MVGAGFTYKSGFSWITTVIVIGSAIFWIVVAPKRFDRRVRHHLQKQMSEPSFRKAFGAYRVQLSEKHFICESPLGCTEYRLDAIDRATLSEEYLFVMLTGPSGLAIRVAEVGKSVAVEAHQKILSYMGKGSNTGAPTAR